MNRSENIDNDQYRFESQKVESRTNYCVCFKDVEQKVIYMLPISAVLLIKKNMEMESNRYHILSRTIR